MHISYEGVTLYRRHFACSHGVLKSDFGHDSETRRDGQDSYARPKMLTFHLVTYARSHHCNKPNQNLTGPFCASALAPGI